jgi:hypothetical protein
MATKKIGYAKGRTDILKKITGEAKKMRAKNPSMKWTDAVKKAGALYRKSEPVKKPVVANNKRKAAPKKSVAKKVAKKKVSGVKLVKKPISVNVTEVSKDRQDFWLRCFAPRSRAWQNATYQEIKKQLQNGTKNPFESEKSLFEQLRALEYILNRKPFYFHSK